MRSFNLAVLLLVAVIETSGFAQRGPIKVYVLAGQSNMEGKGAAAHLLPLATDKETSGEFGNLRSGRDWRVRKDVWIAYDRVHRNRKVGGLTIGFGDRDDRIGPELGFGTVVGDATKEQVLIIKCCWGGASLKKDFLPPGAGGPGRFYSKMVTEVRTVLARLNQLFPRSRNKKYQFAGFVWFQGWNDSVGGGNPDYTTQLAQLVRDVREDFESPSLPFVIGELGQGGSRPDDGAKKFRAQQQAVADMPEFAGSVAYVPTGIYVPDRLLDLFDIWRRCRNKENRLPDKNDAAAKAEAWAEWNPVKDEWESRASDRPYHYCGSGEVFYRMGAAFGRAMTKLADTTELSAPVNPVERRRLGAARKRTEPAPEGMKKFDHVARRKELQPAINDAIDAGVEWLTARQLRDGSWGQRQDSFATGPTALAVYTLLKCGLGPDQKNVKLGLDYLARHEPNKTYSIGCVMMALEAADSKKYRSRIEALHRKLIRTQNEDGGWAYPTGISDLSNTQYAALGLRAAMLAGIRTPARTLNRLSSFVASTQEQPVLIRLPRSAVGDEKYGPPEGHVAGYSYRPDTSGGHEARSTGSMTCAGISIMAVVRDGYGKKIPRGAKARTSRGIDLGLNWLRANWAVNQNPGAGGGWHHYYLYGLERVGALLLQEVLAGHAWYVEGAEYLINDQEDDGGYGEEDQTCFSLLFLQRATWSKGRTTGRKVGRDAHVANGGDVHLMGSGNRTLSMWLRGFSGSIRNRFKSTADNSMIRVAKVEYLLDGKIVVRKDGDLTHPWRDESYAGLHEFTRNGSYEIKARVHVLPPGATSLDIDTKIEVLESRAIRVTVQSIKDPMADDIARAAAAGLLREARLQHKTSSTKERSNARRAYDGKEGTAWVSTKGDARPTIGLKISRGLKVRHVFISPASKKLAQGKIAKITVKLNGRSREYHAEPVFGRDAVRIDLGKRRMVKELELTLDKSNPNTEVGIAEIYLAK